METETHTQLSRSPTSAQPLLFNSSSICRTSSPIKQGSKQDGSRNPQVLTILNTFHPELFIPYRHMGWNMFDTIRTSYPFVYRINDGMSNNVVLQSVCEERGWQEYKEIPKDKMPRMERELLENSNWNLWWSYNFYQGSPYRTLKCWQYTNHNPRAFQFCSKSYLTSFLRKMHAEFGEAYDFSPKSFIMPEDYIKFVSEHSKRQERECLEARNIVMGAELIAANTSKDDFNYLSSSSLASDGKKPPPLGARNRYPIWIIKPVGKSQGRGIILTKDIGMVASAHRCVVQEYIARPCLIGGYKWDIRIYVCITSTDPLVIYLYREGLCRFATEKFDLANLQACFSHLTNASLNKLGPDYPTDKEVIGPGCKWSLKQLRCHFKKEKIRDWLLWQKIMSLVILTVAGEGLKSGYMFPTTRNCFDFFGFDILVDSNFQPWLLEVNYSPGLGGDCKVDEIVKKPMLHELFDLMGFPNSSKHKRPTSSSASRRVSTTNCSTSSISSKEQKRLKDLKPKLALDCTHVDVSCKARLKEASLIYSQDLVLEYFGNHCRDPKFRMSPTMKIMYDRKIAHAKRRKRFDRMVQKLKKEETARKTAELQEGTDDNQDKESNMDSDSNFIEELEHSSSDSDNPSRPPTANSEDSKKSGEEFIYLQRQDWAEAPLENGNWCCVYPCKAFPYRSQYRSALGDLRGVVKAVENYLAVAESVVKSFPEETDDFYETRVKSLCRWNIGIWCPPGGVADVEESIVEILR